MKKFSFLLCLLLLIFAGTISAEIVQVHFLQTTDVHGVISQDGAKGGSWLKIGSLITEYREKLNGEPCFLIDCGDTIQGSLLSSLSRGEAAIIPLKVLRYDAWIPGNHEFDFGVPRFLQLAEARRDILLCGNLQPVGGTPFPAWKLLQKGNARIALIGMTASYMKFWFGDAFGDSCTVALAEDSLKTIIPEILALKPDMIVLAIHQAWMEGKDPRNVNEVANLVAKFPEIDLIFGGHSHRNMAGHKIGPRTWYVQAGFGAKMLGAVQATIDTEKHAVLEIQSKLIPVQQDTPDSPLLLQAMESWLKKETDAKTAPAAPAPGENLLSKGRPGVDCQTSQLICAAIAEAANVPIVIHGNLSKKNLYAGKLVTEYDLFQLIPYENTIITALVTREELAEIVCEQWKNRSFYTFSGIYGCKIALGANGISAQIQEPDDGNPLTIALNSFTAAGSGRYPRLRSILDQPKANRKDTGISTRDAVRKYLNNHPGIKITPTRFLQPPPRKQKALEQ